MTLQRVTLAGLLAGMMSAGLSLGQVAGGQPGTINVGMVGGIAGGFSVPGVKGMPYSLVEKTTRVQTLADGTTLTNVTEERIMRDSEGRVRTESGQIKDKEFQVSMIYLIDPVGRTRATLFPRDKSAHVTQMAEPKTPTPEQEAKAAEFRARAETYRKEHPAAPNEEDLPGQTIAGVYAEGKRHTLVIPVGRTGNDKEIKVVSETWTSPDLKITLMSTSDDPRMGKITRTVSELQRTEPNATWFQVPAEYKIIEQK